MFDRINDLPLSQSDLERIVKGVPAELDPSDLGQAADNLDADIAADLHHIAATAGLDDHEALAVQIVWVRMYAAKLEQLQAMFENKRH